LLNLLVEFVDLLGEANLVEEFVVVALLSGEEYAIAGKYAQAGAGVGYGLQSVLDLVKAALRREDCRSGIVASGLEL
jgi:hypothetical protein